MPYLRHTTRHITWYDVDHDRELVERVTKDRWNVYLQKPLKDVGDLFRTVRKVVNSDVSRLEAVRSLSLVHPRLIVFYNFDYELEHLRTLFKPAISQIATDSDGIAALGLSEGVYTDTVIAEYNGHRHDPVPRGERWVYLVQYVAGAEGWNCVSTDAMVFYSLTYSYKNWHQAFGRIDRMNTRYSDLHYYVLFSTSWIDLAIRKSLKAKKSFNERQFGVKFAA